MQIRTVHIITGIVMLSSVAIMIISGILLGTIGLFFFWLGANDNACLTFIVGMRLLFLIPLGVGGSIIVIVSKKTPLDRIWPVHIRHVSPAHDPESLGDVAVYCGP